MLKINNFEIENGMEFFIRNSWRAKIAKILGKDEECLPFHYKVVENTNNILVCEGVCDCKSKKKYQIVVTPIVVKYLSSVEVEYCNVGMYFTDYLPVENTKLLILEKKNNSIQPVKFELSVTLTENNIPYLDMVLENLLSEEINSLSAYTKHSWKLLKGSDTYMTDIEKMYQDTFIHKELVHIVCTKFAAYLRKQDLNEDADKLMERANVHDNSKILNKDEFRALSNIVSDRSCLRSASSQLSTFKQDSIELHWKHNSHHPEHYENYEDMTRTDRMEMVCDWMARSLQYKSNLLEFITVRQEERFHFTEFMYDELYRWCKILVSLFE